MALYVEDLKEVIDESCKKPDCDHKEEQLLLAPGCHPEAPPVVYFRAATNDIYIECSRCKGSVAKVIVATKGKNHHDGARQFKIVPVNEEPVSTAKMPVRSNKKKTKPKR